MIERLGWVFLCMRGGIRVHQSPLGTHVYLKPRVEAGLFLPDSQGRGGRRVLPARLTRWTLAQAGQRSEMYTLSSGTSSANQACTFWPVVAQR